MSNSRTRTINYQPRYTQMEAYDLLPSEIRKALMEGPQEWDTGAVLRYYRKLVKTQGDKQAIEEMVLIIWRWHREEVRDGKPWRQTKPHGRYKHLPPSPHVQAGATMLAAYAERPQKIGAF